jgi:hypothetical protein
MRAPDGLLLQARLSILNFPDATSDCKSTVLKTVLELSTHSTCTT